MLFFCIFCDIFTTAFLYNTSGQKCLPWISIGLVRDLGFLMISGEIKSNLLAQICLGLGAEFGDDP